MNSKTKKASYIFGVILVCITVYRHKINGKDFSRLLFWGKQNNLLSEAKPERLKKRSIKP